MLYSGNFYSQCGSNQPPVANPNYRTIPKATNILASSSPSGNIQNILTDDTDRNAANTKTITGFTVAGEAGTPVIGTPFVITGIGSITINANGSYAFMLSNVNFVGILPQITYTMADACGATSSITVYINYSDPANNCPVLSTTAKVLLEDSSVALSMSFSDANGSAGTGYTITITLPNLNNVPNTGIFTANPGPGVTVSGSGTNFKTLQGNFTDLNTYLAAAGTPPIYTPPSDYNSFACGGYF